MPHPSTGTNAIAWVDDIASDQAIGACGAKMGRLAELYQAGVNLPKGFTVTVEAFWRHWEQAGLAEFADAALDGLGPGAEPARIEAAAAAIRAEVGRRAMSADLAALIGGAYEELCSRCFEINVPAAVRSSAIGEDSGTASFAGISASRSGTAGPACSTRARCPTGSGQACTTRTCRWPSVSSS